jgi:leader peptidase (prepilin peptidase)/N-methyltransferase
VDRAALWSQLRAALARTWPLPAFATAGGLLGGLAAAGLAGPSHIVASAALAGPMAAIAAEDYRHFRVPDSWNLVAAATGLLAVWIMARFAASDPVAALVWAALNAVLCGGALLLLREAFLRLRGVDGLGLGDVKLAATGGIWLGWQAFPYAVMLAAASALAYVALSRSREGAWRREQKIPFALHLAPAIWLVWFFSQLLNSRFAGTAEML